MGAVRSTGCGTFFPDPTASGSRRRRDESTEYRLDTLLGEGPIGTSSPDRESLLEVTFSPVPTPPPNLRYGICDTVPGDMLQLPRTKKGLLRSDSTLQHRIMSGRIDSPRRRARPSTRALHSSARDGGRSFSGEGFSSGSVLPVWGLVSVWKGQGRFQRFTSPVGTRGMREA